METYFIYVTVDKDSSDYNSELKYGDTVVHNGTLWQISEIEEFMNKINYTLVVVGGTKIVKLGDLK